MQFHISPDPDQLSHDLAEWLVSDVENVLRKKPLYTLVLSGGNTPKKLYRLLAEAPYNKQIDWSKIHIFFGDERYVPFEDDRNNGKMAAETLLSHVPVPEKQIHYMNTALPLEESAREYEKLLNQYFSEKPETFDLVLLGMGDDGHTLSLFPGTEVIHEQKDWVKAYFVPKLDMNRITLTPPVVNRSRIVLFLVTGATKAATLQEVIEGNYQPDQFPSQIIKPKDGKLIWFLDSAAAVQLNDRQGRVQR